MKVFIDPSCNIVYASYYIDGLYRTYGRSNVKFSAKQFKDLPKGNGIEDFDQYLAFVIDDGKRVQKFAVDFRDKGHLNRSALSWCHVYGKVNYNQAAVDKEQLSSIEMAKLIRVGTNFGVRLWSRPVTGIQFLLNYARCRFSPGVSRSLFFASYRWLQSRAGSEEYMPGKSEEGYVFFISTLWKNDNKSDELNRLRASYIRACKELCPRFEGGLFTKDLNASEEFKDILTDQYVHHSSFTDKIKRSLAVFNTPAVWGCHGWKLGEFLAMGKAIISTPFQNEMPVPMIHGENIHFVSNEEELREAVKKITVDKVYREKLENGALAYHLEHLQPEAVVSKLVGG